MVLDFDLARVLGVLMLQLLHQSEATRQAALRWFLMLREKLPDKIYEHLGLFAPALLKTLSDPADKVVLLALEVLAELSSADDADADALRPASPTSAPAAAASTPDAVPQPVLSPRTQQAEAFFERLTIDLLSLFSTDRQLLDQRGAFIVRQLCLLINPEKIFRALAGR